MTHRAETILETLETVLTGLSTTGARVKRGRVWNVPAVPALTIRKGADVVSADPSLETELRDLDVIIEIHTKQTGNPETALNAIAAEVYAALGADHTLGFDWVFSVELVGDDAPEDDDGKELPAGRLASNWRIQYEHSYVSAEI